MNELQAALRIVLGNTFVMYFKAHSYHWNVTGKYFPMYHEFFGDLYEELHGAVDPIAEEIRALNGFAPFSLTDLYMYKTLPEENEVVTKCEIMITSLLQANQMLLESLNKVFELASAQNEQGLADFISGRIDAHKKHGWMLLTMLDGE